jgi:two-component system, response regulator PdtaR
MVPTNILIVEDEGITAKDIKNSLEKVGHNVMALVTTGEDAISFSEEKKPDLVIMDIKLEGKLDGVDAAKIIESKFGIPIIYLTSYSDKNTIERVKSSNPSAFIIKEPFEFLHKPFEENELHTAIEIILNKDIKGSESCITKSHYQLLKSVLRSVSDGAIATDTEGRIMFMNPSAERFTGTSEESFIGAPLEKLIPNINIMDIIERFNTTAFFQDEFSLKINNNDFISIKGTFTPINNESNSLNGIIILFKN